MEQLKSWLKERHQLAVAVYSTPAAEAVLASNGLSIVDLLRPVSLVNKLNVPMRVGEASTRIQEIKLGLYAASSMFQPKPEVIDESLRQVLSLQAQRHASLQPVPNLIQHVQSEPAESINPWFYGYRAEFLRLVKFTEHETLDHPVGGIFFLPANAAQPLHSAEKLLAEAAAAVPQPLQSSQAMLPPSDPLFAKHWVLVQDVGAPDMDEARVLSNLATLSNKFGAANCSILRLHGSSGGTAAAAASAAGAVPASVFQACRPATLPGGGAGEPEHRAPEPPGGLGHGINPDDMAAAGQLLRDFAEHTLLPRIEERIARLNFAVSNARKGLKNRLTRLWKGAAAEPGPSTDASYPSHSVEGQMRALADLAYLLGQYEFAVQTYRLAAQDYLAAPNSKWYAGAEEMIGICSILTSDPSSDPLKYLNRAYEHYSKVRGRQGRMLATRTMLDAAAYQTVLGRHLAANMSLMRAHFDEEAARAALLLEAAAYSLLRCRPPSVRKAAFHLVLAGLRYHAAKQKRLAIHCYKQVTTIYPAGTWRHINEHLHDILGKQCSELGDPQGCLAHCTALLDCGHRQAAAQAHYLTRFLEAVQAARVSGPLQGLKLPTVITDEVVVRCADQRCYPSNLPAGLLGGSSGSSRNFTAAAAAAGPSVGEASIVGADVAVWGALEQLLAGGEVPSTNWLDGAKQVHDGEEFNTVAAGEDIAVEVTFKNPLAIKLSLSRVRLVVQFTPAGAAAAASSGDHGQQPQQCGLADSPAASAPSVDQVATVEAQFSLHPGEVLTESLKLRPVAAGWLRVIGVSWLLGGVAEGMAEFDVKGRRRKRPKGDRPSQQKHYPPQRRLVFHVLKGMPRLQLSADGLPAEAAAGEMMRLQLQLRNVGLLPACNLKVAVSSPGVALAAATKQQAAAAAAATAGSGDVWQHLTAAQDVITPLRAKAALHRRHKSSAAALFHNTPSSSSSSSSTSTKRTAISLDGGSSSTAAAAATGDVQQGIPHIQSMPVVHEGAVAAAASISSPRASSGAEDQGQGSAAAPHAVIFQLGDADLVLEPGQSLSVPMWVHVQQPGQFIFQCAWFCEPQVSVSASMRYRVLLTHHRIAVSSLLDVASPSVSPCVKDLHCYNLRLQATASKDTSGMLVLHQLSCLSAGADAGWRMRSYTAAAAGTPGDTSLQQSLQPGLKLEAGGSCTHFVQLVSPAAGAGVGSSSSNSSSSSTGELLPVLRGPLHYFYKKQIGLAAAAAAAYQGVSSGRGGTAAGALQQLRPKAARPLESEAHVDLLLMWRFEPKPPGINATTQQQQQQQQRVGFICYGDLCAAQQLNPVRMTLDGPGLRAPYKHDFIAASLCILPLTLKLRNCGTASVSLTVRTSEAWEGVAAENAWWATPTPPGSKFAGLLGSSAAAAAGSSGGGTPVAAGLASAYGPLGAGATNVGSAGLRGPSPLRGTANESNGGGGSHKNSPRMPDSSNWQQQQLGATDSFAVQAVQAGLPPSTEHVWVGSTCVPVPQLEPGDSVDVALQVAVFQPGVYVIDDYGIDWRCDGAVGPGGRWLQGSKVGEAIVLKVVALKDS